MDKKRVIYSINVEDILTVIDDSDIDIEIDDSDMRFIEEKVGEMIDWSSAVEYALSELENEKAKKANGANKGTKR